MAFQLLNHKVWKVLRLYYLSPGQSSRGFNMEHVPLIVILTIIVIQLMNRVGLD
jgi:hypothetical protein